MTQGQLLLHSFSTHHIHQHTLHEHYALCAIFRQKLNPWLFKIGLSPMIPRLQSPHFKNEKIFELRESDLQCLHCKLNCTACADVTDGFRAWNAEGTSRKGFSTFLQVRTLNKQAIDKVLSTSFFYRTQVRSLAMLVTSSLTHPRSVNLIDMTLAWEDAYSKLVEVVTVAEEDRVGNSLLQIWKLLFSWPDLKAEVWS